MPIRLPNQQLDCRIKDNVSIYEQRETRAYDWEPVNTSYAKNEQILAWWSPEHDKTLLALITEWQWDWLWHVTEAITSITPKETIEAWRKADPICRSYAWYNVIMYFALARARTKGYDAEVRTPLTKQCPLCGNSFVENSLPSPLIARLGIDGLDFCSPCLSSALFQGTGNDSMIKEDVLEYLRLLSETIEQIPRQGYGEGGDDLRYLDKEQRLRTIRVLQHKPTVRRVKKLYGSWLKALVESGLLEDGKRKTARGTQCLAKDGHICYSLAEKTIDDYLYRHNIKHEKEPGYPASNMRADFRIGPAFVEYFGLHGDPEYDAKTKRKTALCMEHGITLISLFPKDVVDRKSMEKKLATVLQSNHAMQPTGRAGD